MIFILSTLCLSYSKKDSPRKTLSNKYVFGTSGGNARIGDLSCPFLSPLYGFYQPFSSGSCLRGDKLEYRCGSCKLCGMSNPSSVGLGCLYWRDTEHCTNVCVEHK